MKDHKRDKIEEVVNELDSKDVFIDSCRMVIKKIEEDQAGEADADRLLIKEQEACKIMRGLGMRYVKVQHIALSANSERSLVLRQQWAIKLIQ